jgi:hypothetical protein
VLYQVTRPYGERGEVSESVVSEAEIVAGPLPVGVVPVLAEHVSLSGEAGVVVAIDGDANYTIEMEVPLTLRRWRRRGDPPMGTVSYVRSHTVSRQAAFWQACG